MGRVRQQRAYRVMVVPLVAAGVSVCQLPVVGDST